MSDFFIGFVIDKKRTGSKTTDAGIRVFYIQRIKTQHYDDKKYVECVEICNHRLAYGNDPYKSYSTWSQRFMRSSIRDYFKSELNIDPKLKKNIDRVIIQWAFEAEDKVWKS